MFVEKVDALLQNSGLVHFPGVAWQHGTQLLDEDIKLVSALLLRFITRHTVDLDQNFFPLLSLSTAKSNESYKVASDWNNKYVGDEGRSIFE